MRYLISEIQGGQRKNAVEGMEERREEEEERARGWRQKRSQDPGSQRG